jgi:lysophospholipase L1-like esterase
LYRLQPQEAPLQESQEDGQKQQQQQPPSQPPPQQQQHLQSAYADDPATVFVVMIGTNNLGAGELPKPTSKGILAVLEYLLQHTNNDSHILWFPLLPRGDGKTWLPNICPPRCDRDGKPFRSFRAAIKKVNELALEGVAALNDNYKDKKGNSRIKVVECGAGFLNMDENDELEVKKELMPDLLHPNLEGHKLLAKCIREAIDPWW